MTDTVIRVENLGKEYRLGKREGYRTLRDSISETAAAAWNRLTFRNPTSPADDSTFWALREVSFEVKQGEVVGVIGRNGAGKSTLLKILSQITEPTTGRIELTGRVGSLLEVGTGFHPELTGRENIYLNGAILGMKRTEITRKFDEIVAFAEVEQFIDTPVKHYSSGMYMRLAFAVAAHLEPEVLVVDEVLAVGDAEFQKKCLGKMRDVSKQGRTILFVSHNMAAVKSLCQRVLVLGQGRVLTNAPTLDEGIRSYLSQSGALRNQIWERTEQIARGPMAIERAELELVGQQPNHELHLRVTLRSRCMHRPAFLAANCQNAMGDSILQAVPSHTPFLNYSSEPQTTKVVVYLPPLIPACYYVSIWVGSHFSETFDHVQMCLTFTIDHSPTPGRSFPHGPDQGYIVPRSEIIAESKAAAEKMQC